MFLLNVQPIVLNMVTITCKRRMTKTLKRQLQVWKRPHTGIDISTLNVIL